MKKGFCFFLFRGVVAGQKITKIFDFVTMITLLYITEEYLQLQRYRHLKQTLLLWFVSMFFLLYFVLFFIFLYEKCSIFFA